MLERRNGQWVIPNDDLYPGKPLSPGDELLVQIVSDWVSCRFELADGSPRLRLYDHIYLSGDVDQLAMRRV